MAQEITQLNTTQFNYLTAINQLTEHRSKISYRKQQEKKSNQSLFLGSVKEKNSLMLSMEKKV